MVGDDTLEPPLAGVLENGRAVAGEMLIERNPAADLGQEPFKPDLARPQFLWTVVDAIEFQQVEGIEKHPVVICTAGQLLEDGQAGMVAIDGLAVDRDRARPQRPGSVDIGPSSHSRAG